MPTFSYKGYDFEVAHQPTEQEFAQMSAYVDTLPPKQEKKKASIGTAIKSSFAGLGNTADLVGTSIAAGGASLFGDDEEMLRLMNEMEDRRKSRQQWANPDQEEITGLGKVAGAVATLPGQILSSALSPAETAYQAKKAGESSSAARKAAMVDAAANAAGLALPGFVQGSAAVRGLTGFGANAAQDYLSKKGIQSVLDTEQGKAQFEPTLEDAIVSGVVGGGFGVAAGRGPKPKATRAKSTLDALDAILEKQKAPVQDAQRPVPGSNAWQDAQLKLRAELDAREMSGPANELSQLELMDQPEQGRMLSPYEAVTGDWRVDENGMPIKVDLSMEAQNLEQPLQRNLWGDELGARFPRDPAQPLGPLEYGDIQGMPRFSDPINFRNDPENQRPLTEAIDSMEPEARTAALEQTKMGREMPASPEMEVAKRQSEIASWLESNKRPPVEKTPLGSKARKQALARVGRAKRQGGGVTTDIFGRTPERSGKLHDVAEFLPYRFQVLESMPNKDIFTAEQLRSAMNRDGVSAQEKSVLTLAWDITRDQHGEAPDGSLFIGKAKATEFVDAINQVTEQYALSRTPSEEYSTYGLDRLGRDAGERWEPIPRNEWTEAQRQENIDYNIYPERRVQTSAAVKGETNVWQAIDELSANQLNHFDDPNYVGHTRNFKEDGVRHVVEIQSDLLQQYRPGNRDLADLDVPTLSNLVRDYTADVEWMKSQGDSPERVDYVQGLLDGYQRELNVRNNKRPTTQTVLQKNWAVRLIREELADAARNREPNVRFATADTMAKVEGWEDKTNQYRELAKDMLRQVAAIDSIRERDPSRFAKAFEEDRAYYLKEAEDAGKLFLEAQASGKKFDPSLQGIYDRYQKEVTKYLKSIGGKEVTDDKGHTWIEVPVEASRKRPIMFGQKGALLIDWKNKDKTDALSKVAGLKDNLKNLIPTEMEAPEVIALAKQAKDVDQNFAQKAINLFTKGGLYQAEKTGNPVIKFVVDRVLNADRKARADVRDYIHDSLAPAMRSLSNDEMTEVATVLNYADLKKVELTEAFLREQGFSEKQIAFVNTHRETMDYAFESLNRARAVAGKPPIDKRVSYAAMSATGDYRKLVYKLDANGEKEVVGIIGANTRNGLGKVEAGLKDYIFGEERYMGGRARNRGGSDVQAVMQALEHLSDTNPHTKEFLEILSDLKTRETYSFVNTQKHTQAKKGVFGMEGRKQWKTALENSKDFMDAQLRYAEQAIKWGHLSEASVGVKEVLSSDVNMPNAKKWSEAYFQNALGMNPSETGRALESAMDSVWKSVGIGRQIPANIQGYSRKIVNTMLLGLNPAFLATNVVQPLLAMPAMNSFLRGRGLDEASLLGLGFDAFAEAGFTKIKQKMGKENALEKAAAKYARDNHVFGTELVDTSSVSRKNAEYYIDKTGNFLASNVESFTREATYYAFVHILNKNGLGNEFGLAHNLTDMAMNNYAPVERSPIFNALGPIGDLASNLSSFKYNELSRLALFAREIGKDGNAKPLLTQLAMGVAAAGITGSIAFAEADWLYRQISKAIGKPDSLTRVVIEFSENMSEYTKGKYALSHGGFSYLGLDLSKRLGVSDVVPNSVGEALFPGGSKLVDVAGAGLSAISSPSELNLKRLAREAAPGVATGPMDRSWFSQQTPEGELAVNRRTLDGQVIRNEADKTAKNFGFTGINESVAKQKLYDLQQQGISMAELRSAVVKKMAEQLYSKETIDPKLFENYAKYEGDLNTLTTELTTKVTKQQMSMVNAAKIRAMAAKSTPQLMQGQRAMESLNGIQ